MSFLDLERAMELAPNCEDYMTGGGKQDEEIQKAEQLLGIRFSPQCLAFYRKCGYLSFFGTEIFGIDPYHLSGILAGNSVAYALHEREEYNLPKAWLSIFDYSDGYMAFLDYSTLNQEMEPAVIVAFFDGCAYKMVEKIAEDFGAFLLEKVKEALGN